MNDNDCRWLASLAVDADVVVLDEPTSQLDRATARLISRAIKDIAQGVHVSFAPAMTRN